MGIEPTFTVWQTVVLAVILHLHLEPAGNYDIPTPCLQGKCSASELCRHLFKFPFKFRRGLSFSSTDFGNVSSNSGMFATS